MLSWVHVYSEDTLTEHHRKDWVPAIFFVFVLEIFSETGLVDIRAQSPCSIFCLRAKNTHKAPWLLAHFSLVTDPVSSGRLTGNTIYFLVCLFESGLIGWLQTCCVPKNDLEYLAPPASYIQCCGYRYKPPCPAMKIKLQVEE